MKAFIMAAGYGTRLEPLTIAVPKPMVPIVNLPTMRHNLELLKKHGFVDICANIHYHPEQIENYFSDGESCGVSLAYSYEEQLLGTAGGVRKMATELASTNETFLVLSSDALTDIDLGKLVAFHKSKKALVTMALAEVADVSQFGIVVVNDEGRISGFQEKPAPEAAKSSKANSGIYVFEPEILKLIPEGPYDFGRQLFPRLVAEKAAVFGYPMTEYWSDVGSLDKYIQANYDALNGRVNIRIPGKKVGAGLIGERCRIGQDVYIKDSVIGDKCQIGDGAVITGSVVWSDTVIQAGAQVTQSVIGSWCHVGAKARIGANSVLANRCLVRPNTSIPPLSRLKPNSVV